MGIFGNLWFGALLARGLSAGFLASCVTLGMVSLHLASGNLAADELFWWHTLDSFYLGMLAWLLLYGGSRADRDLKDSLLEISDAQWKLRAPSVFAARVETAIALTIGLALASLSWIIMQADASEAIEDSAGRLVVLVRWVIDGSLLFHLGSMILRHRRWLHGYIDAELRIDLLHVDRLSVLSNAFVLWLAVLACLIALPLTQFTLLKTANPYELVRVFGALGLGLVVAILLFTPILLTRNRVIDARTQERERATAGLRGEPIPCDELVIRCEGEHYSVAELLGYLQYLDSIWEWPMRRNLARIGFYALIPPIAWVLSAIVEISLSGQLS